MITTVIQTSSHWCARRNTVKNLVATRKLVRFRAQSSNKPRGTCLASTTKLWCTVRASVARPEIVHTSGGAGSAGGGDGGFTDGVAVSRQCRSPHRRCGASVALLCRRLSHHYHHRAPYGPTLHVDHRPRDVASCQSLAGSGCRRGCRHVGVPRRFNTTHAQPTLKRECHSRSVSARTARLVPWECPSKQRHTAPRVCVTPWFALSRHAPRRGRTPFPLAHPRHRRMRARHQPHGMVAPPRTSPPRCAPPPWRARPHPRRPRRNIRRHER